MEGLIAVIEMRVFARQLLNSWSGAERHASWTAGILPAWIAGFQPANSTRPRGDQIAGKMPANQAGWKPAVQNECRIYTK